MDNEPIDESEHQPVRDFKLRVNRDGMSLMLDCTLDPDGLALLSTAIHEQMQNLKIHLPPRPSQVEALLRSQLGPQERLEHVVLLEGKAAVPPIDARIEWSGDFFTAGFAIDPETGNMDFRQPIARTTVAREEHLATRVPGVAGEPGRDIFGRPVRVPNIRVPRIKAGTHVRHDTETDRFYSECDGRIRWQSGVLTVDDVYTVRGSVGLKTGNIAHPGALIIEKDITAGAHVQADGDIEIFGMVEPATIESGGSVTVHGGITGGDGHSIKLRGILKAKYIQDAYVQASGGVIVEKEILHCDIHTRGPVDVARGRIVGGSVRALGGITVGEAGSDANVPTLLITGIDKIYEDRLQERYVEMADLEERAGKIHAAVDKLMPHSHEMNEEKQAKLEKLVDAVREMEERITTLQGYIDELLNKFNSKARHEIHVRRTMHPECSFRIRDHPFKLTKTVPGPVTAYSVNKEFKLRSG